jgi:hypothetical protein
MTSKEVLMLANTLKGAGLSCLFVLSAIREPMTIKELAAYTGYDRKSVAVAMDKLETLELAEKTPGDRWLCSENPNPVCCRFINIESMLLDSLTLKQPQQTNNLPPGGGRISEHSPIPAAEISHLITKLVKASCPKQTAEEAITAALHARSPAAIEAEIDHWLAYCRSPAGKTIKVRGAFVASKIKNGEAPPEPDGGLAAPSWYTREESGLIQR